MELQSDPQECEGDPEAKKGNAGDMLAKCKAGLVDYQVEREGTTEREPDSFRPM